MKKNERNIFILMAAALLLLPRKATAGTAAITNVLKTFIPEVEGFTATPYWDFKQWTWGYGTKVPGSVNDSTMKPTGTITRDQAFADMLSHIQKDFDYLYPMVTRQLNANQWAAYLSFAYNTGQANADNLITNINSNNDPALFTQWRLYVYAGGVRLQGLVDRREKEIALWKS